MKNSFVQSTVIITTIPLYYKSFTMQNFRDTLYLTGLLFHRYFLFHRTFLQVLFERVKY